MSVNTQRV